MYHASRVWKIIPSRSAVDLIYFDGSIIYIFVALKYIVVLKIPKNNVICRSGILKCLKRLKKNSFIRLKNFKKWLFLAFYRQTLFLIFFLSLLWPPLSIGHFWRLRIFFFMCVHCCCKLIAFRFFCWLTSLDIWE